MLVRLLCPPAHRRTFSSRQARLELNAHYQELRQVGLPPARLLNLRGLQLMFIHKNTVLIVQGTSKGLRWPYIPMPSRQQKMGQSLSH